MGRIFPLFLVFDTLARLSLLLLVEKIVLYALRIVFSKRKQLKVLMLNFMDLNLTYYNIVFGPAH